MVVSYTNGPDVHSGRNFSPGFADPAGCLLCGAMGLGLYDLSHPGLFGLDKWHQPERSVAHLASALRLVYWLFEPEVLRQRQRHVNAVGVRAVSAKRPKVKPKRIQLLGPAQGWLRACLQTQAHVPAGAPPAQCAPARREPCRACAAAVCAHGF